MRIHHRNGDFRTFAARATMDVLCAEDRANGNDVTTAQALSHPIYLNNKFGAYMHKYEANYQ